MGQEGEKQVGMKFDVGKLLYNLIPAAALEGIAKVFTYGAQKYAPDNWKYVEPKERYLDASLRHLQEVRKGNWIDEITDGGSGLPHIDHAIVSLMMYREKCLNQFKKEE